MAGIVGKAPSILELDDAIQACIGGRLRTFLAVQRVNDEGWGGLAKSRGQGRSSSMLFVFLWGSPSHLDTIDKKPDVPANYRNFF
jgi:hypothetical protein